MLHCKRISKLIKMLFFPNLYILSFFSSLH
uniref:Uncharacterized protein n=1 Tax=Arundo donax TaxID=35708 RepID=A0A0A9FRP6_ARUDO